MGDLRGNAIKKGHGRKTVVNTVLEGAINWVLRRGRVGLIPFLKKSRCTKRSLEAEVWHHAVQT